MTSQQLFFNFKANKTVAVALKNGTTEYREEMNWCVFDIDNQDDFEATREVAHSLLTFITLQLKMPSLVTFSGGKGFHVWIFFDQTLSVDEVARFQYYIASEMGWPETAADEYHCGETHIETLIASGKGKVVKLPFSLHPKKSGRWEIPLTADDVLGFNPDVKHNTKNTLDILTAVERANYRIVQFYGDKVRDRYTHRHIEVRRGRPAREVSSDWVCPATAPRQDEILAHVISTPCLRSCYQYIIERKKGGYSQRVNLVVALAKAGFTRDEIGVWFRTNINDEEDNSHTGILEYQVGYWYPQTTLCKCSVFQDQRKRNFCCPGYCGKSDPAFIGSVFPDIADAGKNILERCEEILDLPGNVQVFKTTRAGATTSLILAAVKKGQRVIILEPTNELCENKLAQIMKVAETYSDIPRFKGIALTDNRRSCLKLALKANDLRVEHGVERSEWEKFPFALKPSCEKCFYAHYPMPFEDMKPLAGSDVRALECALSTVQGRIGEASVVACTYAKFNAMMQAVDSSGEQASYLISQLLLFDCLIFDEFSHYVESPSLDVTMKATWLGGTLAYNILDSIAFEMRELLNWKPDNKTLLRIGDMTEAFRVSISEVLNRIDLDKTLLTEILSADEQLEVQMNFTRYVKPLLDFMEERDINVSHLFAGLDTIAKLPVAITKVKTVDFDEHVSAKKPGALEMAQHFVSLFQGKVIVTDATMPLAEPADVLGVPFEKYNIGDPNGTAQHTRFFADTWELRTPDLIDESRGALDILVKRILTVFQYYNPQDVFIVAPSILTSKFIRRALDAAGYPAINMTHQRSDKTIGRDSEFRVMLMVGSPFTPSDAFSWLTLFDKTADPEKIWYWNAMKWAFQSASRVKDPAGREPSVVIGIGIPEYQARRFFNSQYLVNPPMTISGLTDFESTVVRSQFWKKAEFNMTLDEISIARKVLAGDVEAARTAPHIREMIEMLKIGPREGAPKQ